MPASTAPDDAFTLERADRLEDLRADWTRLAEATAHPFATWEWNARWWEHFGPGRELLTFACRDRSGEVVAILPLYVATSRPLRIARFLGYGDLQSPVCAPEHRPLAARALARLTRRPAACRLVLAERLPGGQGWEEVIGGRKLSSHHDPVLPFAGMTWDEFLASRSKNFRDQVRRRERKLGREHELAFRLADDPARLDADMDTLFALHAARWSEESTGVFDGPGAPFHRAFARDALERGWLRLWFTELDGETVAAWYGWRFAGSEWYYQAGRDGRFESLSLGFVMLAHTIRSAREDGAESYHFLAGDEGYKARFASEDPGATSHLLGPAALLRPAAEALTGGSSLPAPLRRVVMRVAG